MSEEERNKATEGQAAEQELTDSELEDVAGGAHSVEDKGSFSKVNPPGTKLNEQKRRFGGEQS